MLGGGGALNSAYSAIASVPGAYVPANQNGYLQAVHVRGGDASEVGYEFDGIPVNRAFDNYPSGSLSSLGQLELQVYTGATPANAEAQGLAGFINQVIKTGTFPGYATREREHRHADLLSQPQRRGRRRDRRTGSSRITSASAATIKITATSISSAAPPTRASSANSSARARPVGPDRHRAAVVLHQRQTERRPQRYARLDSRTDRLRIDQRGQRRQSRTSMVNLHVGIPHKNDRPARRRAAALRQRRDLHDVLELGQRRRLSTTGSIRSAPFRPTISIRISTKVPSARFLPANYRSLVTPYLYPSSPRASVLRPDSRSVQPARPRLQRPGDRQAAVSKELQLERVHAALRLHVLLRLDRKRSDDVAAAVRLLRLAATTRSTTTRAA